MDLDSFGAGWEIAEIIQRAVGSCAVLVALIGPQWVTLTDEEGGRRLDNPDDFVRLEVQTALERGVQVIPVLVDGAKPLRRQELPAELHKLARLSALELSPSRYKSDMDRLLDFIRQVFAEVSGQEGAKRLEQHEAERPEQWEAEQREYARPEYEPLDGRQEYARPQGKWRKRLEARRQAREEAEWDAQIKKAAEERGPGPGGRRALFLWVRERSQPDVYRIGRTNTVTASSLR